METLLVLLGLLAVAVAQAPGDADPSCLASSTAPDYAATVQPLLDSWRYSSLLGEDGVWTTIDQDNSGNGDGHNWQSMPSLICQESVFVLEPSQLPQSNWLITQHVSTGIPASVKYSTTVFVNITYKFSDLCQPNSCFPGLHLKKLFINTINETAANITQNYDDITTFAPPGVNDIKFNTTEFMVNLDPSAGDSKGFYLSLVDNGTNVTVSRLLVYRIKGPAQQQNLTLYPETPAPASGDISVTAHCVANAQTANNHPPNITLSSTGVWSSPDQCLCIEGHEPMLVETNMQCQACPLDHYKSSMGNTQCEPCPAKSQSSVLGAAICQCDSGSYRGMNEGPEFDCTDLPGPPGLITVVNTTNVTAHVTWDPVEEDGGRNDVFYRLELQTGNSRIVVDPSVNNTHYHIVNLTAGTAYTLYVVSENGVSFHVNGFGSRFVFTTFRTAFGVAAQVKGVHVTNGLLVWNSLDSSRGAIVNYQVKFFVNSPSETSTSAINVGITETLYAPNITADFPPSGHPVRASVRGFTSIGAGPWSDPIVFAAINPLGPSIVMPSSSMTTASPSKRIPQESPTIPTQPTKPPTSPPSTTPPPTTPPPPDTRFISIAAALGAVVAIIVALTLIAIVIACIRKRDDVVGFFRRKVLRIAERGGTEFTDTQTYSKLQEVTDDV